jgi:DNA-binding GntR family transcriptional regulator
MANATERAYAQLKTAILDGTLPAGSQIKEEEIAALCSVSRTPVRDALRRLEAEMFVERTDTQRSFVSDWSQEDVAELFTLRAMLESYATERAARNMTPAILEELRKTACEIASAVAQDPPDVDRFVELNALFHRLILQAAGSERLTTMLGRLVIMPIVHLTVQRYGRDELGRSAAEHQEIITAFERCDPQWAGAVMTAHIRRALHTHLIVANGVAAA